MLQIVVSIFSLLFGTAMLVLGSGLQGTLVGVRADIEGFDTTMTGIVMSAFFAGFAIGTYICPTLIRRVGHIRAYAAMATLGSIGALMFALSSEPIIWVGLRILTGICVVGLYMAIESWLNTLAPDESRGQFFGSYILITLFATALSQTILLFFDPRGFELFAITSILISLALVPVALTRIEQPRLITTPKLNLKFLFHKSPQGLVGTFMSGLIVGSIYGMMPVYTSQLGLTTQEIAWYMTTLVLGGAVLQWPIGSLSDRFDRRLVLIAISLFAAVMGGVLFLAGDALHWASYVVLFIFGGMVFSLYGISVAHVNDRIDKEQILEATRGLMQVYGVGAVLGPVFTSLMMEQLGPGGIYALLAASLIVLSMFTFLRMSFSKAPKEDEQSEFMVMNRTSPEVLKMNPLSEESG